MLQRIYGTAWETQEDLENYLNLLKEAEKEIIENLERARFISFSRRGSRFSFLARKRLDII